ncbi:MAG TPA: NAD(P)/FAD-dependent oxidoreductase, partial [Vicinamibacteria bacterium]|nr:NAD(P)/FAD-dependent oxidoreductase [Vicinamibacteria bacterium]
LGGASVTEEFHPGFKASTVAHLLGPLRASVVEDLDLRNRGLAFIEPEPRVFAPLAGGGGVSLWGDPGKTAFELRKLSAKDADSYPRYHASLTTIATYLSRLLALTPPDIDRPLQGPILPWLGLGMGFRGLGREDAQRLLRWGPMAVADFASEWFSTEVLRAMVCGRGIHGVFGGPWSAGTTANLLLQAAGGDGNGAGTAVQLVGGLGSLVGALTAAARQHGAEIRTKAEVERITVKDGRVTGVVLAGGEEIAARAVVSGADPKRTFLSLLDPAVLDPDDVRRLRNYRQQGMASKVNLALDALPAFRGEVSADHLRGRIHIGPEVDLLERAFDEAKYGGISGKPYLEATIPTLSDPTLAPAGRHVMSVYVQFTPYALREGTWDARRDELGDAVLRTLEEYAPGLTRSVIGRQVLTPVDLERTYGLTGGHPAHGEMALDQLFLARPLLGWGRYRAPLPGLYMCGAGTHPGGGVTGGPAANAAREILADLK